MVSVSSGNKHRDTTCPLISWGHGGGEGDLENLGGHAKANRSSGVGYLCGMLRAVWATRVPTGADPLGLSWVRRQTTFWSTAP